MPIRFRCVYCNQLMGIARRKAGTVVRCPSCASQVTVPAPAPEAAAKEASEPAAPLFERSDFDELFNPAGVHARPAAPPPPAPLDFPRAPMPPTANPDRGDLPTAPSPTVTAAERPGFWLTPGMATLISVGVIVALALAFAAGLFVGIRLKALHEEGRLHEPPNRPVAADDRGFISSFHPTPHFLHHAGRERDESA